jgi:hypothetical protein
MRVVTFDIEIKNEIDRKTIGWTDYDKMGISVLAAQEGPGACVRFFDDSLASLQACVDYLATADVIAGFNTLGFDMPVLAASMSNQFPGIKYPERQLSTIPHLDVLDLMVREEYGCGIGEGKEVFGLRVVKGKKLDVIAERTLGVKKSGHGAMAPKLYRDGRFAELFDYAAMDVWIETTLVAHVLEHKSVVGPRGVVDLSEEVDAILTEVPA